MLSVRWGIDLAEHARELLGGDVETGRLCPTCASTTHGKPWVRRGATTYCASLSRASDELVSVIADHPVGVDVEVGTAGLGWAVLEAMLKVQGTGFATREIEASLFEVVELEAPRGFVAALATYAGKSGSDSE